MRDYICADSSQQVEGFGTQRLFAEATRRLAVLRSRYDNLGKIADQLAELLPSGFDAQIADLKSELEGFAAPVTFVGQVKSGKTALVSTLAGSPRLLPSDVNPWTSAVTTLHLNTVRPRNVRAEFAFFDQNEWEELIHDGGRLGTLARRAGADDELSQIREQIEGMYRKSRERLGRNFELLLGNRHKYDEFNQQLIERYVCLGDQYSESDMAAQQGRFADITRSAEIYLETAGYPIGLSLQDTPGVNDPFLMREQVTLRSMSTASICVLVLSAAQAMNTVDLALVQLLTALEGSRVIVFVNRIDELADPERDIAEIRSSLSRTLRAQGIDDIGHILFGSAHWAEAALAGNPELLSEDSTDALNALSNFASDCGESSADFTLRSWQHCGVPELLEAISEIVAETSGAELLDRSARKLGNLIAATHTRQLATTEASTSKLTEAEARTKLANLRRGVESHLEAHVQSQLPRFEARAQQCSADYVSRTVQDLLDRAKEQGRAGVEACDPIHLRMRLRTAYVSFINEMRTVFQEISDGTTLAITDLFGQMLGEAAAEMQLQSPTAPAAPPPVALGRTIIVDLQTTRWKAWMAAHINSRGLAREYQSLVETEVGSIVEELIVAVRQMTEAMTASLLAFMDEQEAYALSIARGEAMGPASPPQKALARQQALEELRQELRHFQTRIAV
ncbi:dynamin family protein [Xinfangfangia sp. CPCC 101601]|uniref:Dynamin family protein n=1 Tax=Pseudogemmobacter lacusdianii TaxID=3069608 RepID=A0ABU0W0T3_9RHOB|nr:dynamin family protein [Xinfangfangia sp. CPCC 101601]MDQ2067624.1 dynamin family protein [Xinfangfangia sp. CPCC 101601]